MTSKGNNQFEHALELLFDKDDDKVAFEKIVDVIGGMFDVLGFIFFLKDSDRYLPIRSRIFDERFNLLGLDSDLAGDVTWEKYTQYLQWVREVQDYLCKHVNKDITFLDASPT